MDIGRTIGRYRVEARIGAGAMATVYRVRRDDEAVFALKILDAATLERRRRFVREARLQATIDHDNVVRVLDEIEIDDLPALLLELVAGPSLARLLADHRPAPSDLDDLARQMIEGVGAAHRRGIVHRDLKPDNVLVAIEGRRLVPKVADFGVAADLSAGAAPGATAIVGTPAYMAPEQIAGAEADARADVFALGAVLYELLAGRRAFGGGSVGEVQRAILAGRPEPLADDLPPRMARAVTAALSPDPRDRPADADALGALWADGTAAAPPDPRWIAQIPTAAAGPVLLPPTPDAFVGREADLDAIVAAVAAHRFVTLRGTGGVGKTRLAIAAARRAAQDHPGGVWFVDLTPVKGQDGIVAATARALGLPIAEDLPDRLVRALARRDRCLLVLDNAERVADAAGPLVARWLADVPTLSVIATSRRSLFVDPARALHEHIHEVSGLDEPDAVALMIARGLAARPDCGIDADRDLALALVRALDALPLAIELAAARLRSTTPDRLIARLDQRFRVLRSRRADLPERQRTLEATLQWSWELLSPPEQAAAARLSVFAGPFTPALAAPVIGADPDPTGPADPSALIAALADHSWLVRTGDRYRMLVSVAAFAADRLGPARTEAEARHGAAFAALGWHPDALDDLIAATRRAVARTDAPIAATCCNAAWRGLLQRGPLALGAELAEAVIALGSIAATDRARCEIVLARSRFLQGRADDARPILDAALDRATAADDANLEAAVRIASGRLESSQGRNDAASAHFEAILARPGDPEIRSQALVELGNLAFLRGEMDRARERYLGALEALGPEAAGSAGAYPRGNLALLAAASGDPDARSGLEASVSEFRAIGDHRGEATYLMNLGTAAQLAGRWSEARSRFLAAHEISRRLGDLEREGQTLFLAGGVEYSLGERERAHDHLTAALHAASTQGDRRFEAHARAALALIASDGGETDRALAGLDEAEALFASLEDHYGVADVISKRSGVELAAGRPANALATARRGADPVERARRPDMEARMVCAEAAALLAAEGPDRAAPLLAQALSLGRKTGTIEVEAEALKDSALAALQQRRFADAIDLIREARKAAHTAGPRVEANVVVAGVEIFAAAGERDEAKRWRGVLPEVLDRSWEQRLAKAESLMEGGDIGSA